MSDFMSRQQVKEVDRRAIEQFGVPGIVLMENAGRGVAELLLALGIRGPIVICCGKGNNGGDGFVIARHLFNRHISVRVVLFCRPDDLSGDAAINCNIVQKMSIPLEICENHGDPVILPSSEWIVDALFGTGLRGAVRPPLDRVIEAINNAPARVLAVDIPSGLDCDTGDAVGPAVRADHTATFVAMKTGYANPDAQQYLGLVHVIDIGAPRQLKSS